MVGVLSRTRARNSTSIEELRADEYLGGVAVLGARDVPALVLVGRGGPAPGARWAHGAAWVSVTPSRVGACTGFAVPQGWAAFPELNVRSYVRAGDGQHGIWFLGMVTSRWGFNMALRRLGLSYDRFQVSASVRAHGGSIGSAHLVASAPT